MSILDRAQAHFAAYKARPVIVPEWLDDAGKPSEVFVKPITMSMRRLLDRKHADDSQERMITIIIRNVVDADDKPVFDEADRRDLSTAVASGPLERLALAAAGVSMDELIGIAEKN